MAESTTTKPGSKWRLPLLQGILPIRWAGLGPDLFAGVTLAAMNIPQAMGYTKIAGMPVITGLYTLLLPLLAFALFGSSRYLVVAADSATAAIIAGELVALAPLGSPKYVTLAGMAALLTAGSLVIARLLRLGFLADFLSRTVLIGFLTGVGFQVGIAVLGEILGIPYSTNNTLEQLLTILRHWPDLHIPTLAVAASVVAVILLTRRFYPKFPGAFLAVAGAILASFFLDFSRRGIAVVGPVTGGLPPFFFPGVSWEEVNQLLSVAGSCFVMIIAQSSATARAYALRHRDRWDENTDLMGLAMANAGAAFTGSFVVNGSPTQTAMVESSGGRSQIAQLSTAAVVALVLLFFTAPLQYLPRCVLGAIVLTVATRLIDWRGLRDIRRKSPSEFYLAAVTAAAVVLIGVEEGIIIALVLSLFDHVRHGYQPYTAVIYFTPDGLWQTKPVAPGSVTEPGVIVYRFAADLFYANVDHFVRQVQMLVETAPEPVRWLVVDADAITNIDYSAGCTLRELQRDLARRGVTLVFAHVVSQLRVMLDRLRLSQSFGAKYIFHTLREAMVQIHQRNSLSPGHPTAGKEETEIQPKTQSG